MWKKKKKRIPIMSSPCSEYPAYINTIIQGIHMEINLEYCLHILQPE